MRAQLHSSLWRIGFAMALTILVTNAVMAFLWPAHVEELHVPIGLRIVTFKQDMNAGNITCHIPTLFVARANVHFGALVFEQDCDLYPVRTMPGFTTTINTLIVTNSIRP